jgi:hypothetical protein
MQAMEAGEMDTVQGQALELRAAVARFLCSWDRLRTGSGSQPSGLEELWHHHEAMGEAWAEHRAAERGLRTAGRDLVLAPFGLRLAVSDFLAGWEANSKTGDNGLPLQLARRHLQDIFNTHVHAPDLSTL